MEIKDRLQLILKEKNLTKADLSRLLPFDESNIGKYCKGALNPGTKFITLLKEKLDINPTWILHGEGAMFLNENQKNSYPADLINLMRNNDLIEQEVVNLVENYLQLPSKKSFDLFIKASKGDKTAIEDLSKYFEALTRISDE